MIIYDDDDETVFNQGSYGWWVWPGGDIEECPDEGMHLDLAYSWLDDSSIDPNDAIEQMLQRGAIRVATFHGSDEMNVNFNPLAVTPQAKKSMLRLMAEQRDKYHSYWLDDASQPTRSLKAITYQQMAGVLRQNG